MLRGTAGRQHRGDESRGDQLSPPILEMLREFFDNLVLARG